MSSEAYDDGAVVAEMHAIAGTIAGVKAALVREWVRATLVPPALKRMYNIGMGVTTFDVPTMAGNVVNVPAPPSVQQRALAAVIAIGVPPQLGITSESSDIPGVIALGTMEEMAEARAEAHGARFPMRQLSQGGIEIAATEPTTEPATEPTSETRYTPPAGHEVVEVIEGVDGPGVVDTTDLPPAVISTEPTLAQRILAKRRERTKRPVGQ